MAVENLGALSSDEHAAHVDVSEQKQDAATQEAAAQRQSIAESDASYVTVDREISETRAEVEQRFAEAREEIDARYVKKVETAEEQRVQQHSKNLEKREDALGKAGLNPNGSVPHSRPQAVVDRSTRRVVEVSV